MPHIDFESYRVRRALRFFTYGLMTMATVVLSALVILVAMGYRFDRDNFGVVQDGLLQLATHPVDAQYKLNGKPYKKLTPDKQTLPAGNYKIELEQTGYRPWQRDVTITAGNVLWVNYPRLIPTTLSTKVVKDYEAADFAKRSPDKRWLLVNFGSKDKDKLELVDFKDAAKPVSQTITIPESQLTKVDGKLGTLGFVEWALDSKTVLLTHTVGDTVEFLRLDREDPSKAINISQKFLLKIKTAHFTADNTNVIYAMTGDTGVLRRLDLGNNTASGSLMNEVKEFEMHGSDTVVFRRFTAPEGTPGRMQELGARIKSEDVVMAKLAPEVDAAAVYGEFDGRTYFTVINRTTQLTTIYQDIQDASKRTQAFASFSGIVPTLAKFSPNSRFLVLQGQNNNYAVYDFYEQEKIGYTMEGMSPDEPVQWIDSFHLSSLRNGKLVMWDFDGFNAQELVAAAPGVDVLFDEDDDILFTLTKAEPGSNTTRPFSLTTTSLIVKK